MNARHTQLDPFETALLAELRDHVATRAPRRRPVRRWAAGLAVAAAAGAAVVVTGLGGNLTGVSPAYAVEQRADGDVVVTITRLEDAEGLEQSLREAGIDAAVSYDEPLEDGLQVEVGRLADELHDGGPAPTDGSIDYEAGVPVESDDPNGPLELAVCGFERGRPAVLEAIDDGWRLWIPAASPLQDRPVQIGTYPGGALAVAYEGDAPGSQCGIVPLPRPAP